LVGPLEELEHVAVRIPEDLGDPVPTRHPIAVDRDAVLAQASD
jgi:hypothetical protein